MTDGGIALAKQAPRHIGAVLEALRRVVGLIFDAEAPFGAPTFRPRAEPLAHELAVAIPLAGDVEGWLAIGASRATMVALARALTGDEAAAMGVMGGQGLPELINVLGGAAAMALHKRGFELELGDATAVVDEPLVVDWPNPMVLEIPIQTPHGAIALALGIRVRGTLLMAAAMDPTGFWQELGEGWK